MTTDEIAAAKQRAEEVVNGFKTVRDQNARDALALAKHAERQARQIDSMKRRMLADSLTTAASHGKASPLNDFFKSLGI